MNYYVWRIDYCDRKGNYLHTAKGILRADSEEEALDILWKKKGSDFAYNPCVGLLDEGADFIEFG